MSRKQMARTAWVALALAMTWEMPPAAAVPPDGDPVREYHLGPDAGPFVVCVKGYSGPSAQALASKLCLHIRKNGFPAYVYDYSGEERRKVKETLEERYRAAPELARKKTIRVEDQWGVLVGGYKSLDDASKDIEKIKKLPWADLGQQNVDHVPDFNSKQMLAMSPYAHSFATRNPTVPMPKPDPNAPDPIWKDLNDGRPYNLLKCGKPWTLAVKQFQGANVVQSRSASSKFLDLLGGGNKAGEMLDASAKQAEEVARLLRTMKPGFDAYVLHTRGGSVVTVGAYDGPEDPKLKQAQQQLRSLSFTPQNGGGDPRAAQMFQFFAQPLPMRVPQL